VHEVSLVQSLLKQVDEIVHANHGRSAVEVRVEIGPLSGVESLLVKAAFAQLTAGTQHGDTTLTIDEVPLTAHCPSCQTEFELEGFRFVCPRCGSRATRVVRGDAFRLMSVTVDVPEEIGST
jgi:hydrogenase nickel incorporation protein HypA/HybF